MRVLLAGGAGYIGSACFRSFRRRGLEAFVLDDLSEGHAAAVEADRLAIADLCDTGAVAKVLDAFGIDHVVHFAAKTSVPGSLADPSGYWSTNVDGSRSLLEAMRRTGVRRIVFSSTAAVYAHGQVRPLREDDAILPATPYGTSKLAVEHLLQGYAEAYGMAAIALRYFNAAGADEGGAHGEAHREETHLIPLVLQTALGLRPAFRIYGTDWPTPDGTCIRDFISVEDLADAHRLALGAAVEGEMHRFNLGTGKGTSVREILAAAEAVTGRPIKVIMDRRRPGDPAVLVADPSRAIEGLRWTPTRSSIFEIMAAAWGWHRLNPSGYGAAVRAA
jgi:UDP-glucose 4-epimerase